MPRARATLSNEELQRMKAKLDQKEEMEDHEDADELFNWFYWHGAELIDEVLKARGQGGFDTSKEV